MAFLNNPILDSQLEAPRQHAFFASDGAFKSHIWGKAGTTPCAPVDLLANHVRDCID
jgi:hypothetical protein